MFDINLVIFEDLKERLKNYQPKETKKNIFQSLSDVFYRENYHSDILAYYLEYDLVRKKLIEWINSEKYPHNSFDAIRFEDYNNGSCIVREEGRRDITVYSNDHKHAIVVENKSNGACDRNKQLVGYVNFLEDNEIQVDALIYLNKDCIKDPNQDGWSDKEKEKINKLLLKTQLIGKDSITTKLINPVISESEDLRLTALSIEIKTLFENIVKGDGYMSNDEIEKFMNYFNENPNNRVAFKNIVKAYNDFPENCRDFYFNYLQEAKENEKINKSFRVVKYSTNCLCIDNIWIDETEYYFAFWFDFDSVTTYVGVKNVDDYESRIKKLMEKMGEQWPFESSPNDQGQFLLKNNNLEGCFQINEIKTELIRIANVFANFID